MNLRATAGVLTGSENIREEGRTDQAVGEARQAVQKAADKFKKAVSKVFE